MTARLPVALAAARRRRRARGVRRVGRAAAARRARARARAAALARALAGLRAGVMSDLHAGVPHAGLDAIGRAVDALNAREPDVHLLLGDYLDASQMLAARARARAGRRGARAAARPRSGRSR